MIHIIGTRPAFMPNKIVFYFQALDGPAGNFINGLQSRPTYASAGRIVLWRGPETAEVLGAGLCPFGPEGRHLLAAGAEIMRQHEVGDARRDFGTEARSVENAVVADAGLQPMGFEVVG
jgi:hypothetical protein